MSRADIKNNIVFYRSYVVINNIYLNGIRIITYWGLNSAIR